jgi:hypothetical protein
MQRSNCDSCGEPDANLTSYQYNTAGPGLYFVPTIDSVPVRDNFHLCDNCLAALVLEAVLKSFKDVPVILQIANDRAASAEYAEVRPKLEKKVAVAEKKVAVMASKLASVDRDERQIADKAAADAREIALLKAKIRALESAAVDRNMRESEAREKMEN